MSKKRYLTKSRFKLAVECPTKLYYTGKTEYANQSLDDSFLAALADGGFQVGELAKLYYPGGVDITTLDHGLALEQTNALLEQEDAVIYEAAICHENLFIRVDVLVKKGNRIDLIEVKAKSFDLTMDSPFENKNGTIASGWKSYLYDIAFQTYVTRKALPAYDIRSFLMLADKSSSCPTDGLNQKFKLVKDKDGRRRAVVSRAISDEDLATKILYTINVGAQCEKIFRGEDSKDEHDASFAERANLYASKYAEDEKIITPISDTCASCEFCTTKEDEAKGLKSGRLECWQQALGWNSTDLDEPSIFDIWNFRGKKRLLEDHVYKMKDVTVDDINPRGDNRPGISGSERQWLQVEKVQSKDSEAWLDDEGLRIEMGRWSFPLHFIDFETSAPAIPFNKGMRPYEGIAFQFSHHVVHEDGRVEHAGEYLNTEPGYFPSFDFMRQLKTELENDSGTIFRYSNHENTYLNFIYRQLKESQDEIADRDELCDFIRSITRSTGSSAEQWVGDRNMVDMWDIVKRYYYDPATNGSNSIKAVLPAILNSSEYLKQKYAEPIYGATDQIPSKNFTDWTWVQFENGRAKDPYSLLPKMFQGVSDHDMKLISDVDELKDGGAALTAYAKMQFEDMDDYERNEIRQALLKYCELDTLAMVMIYEGWQEMLNE